MLYNMVMNKLIDRLHDPRFMCKAHAAMAIVWFLLIVPTVIFWAESVLWVALISCYANAVGHYAAYQATRAEKNNNET